uniref:Uncharacterized protein n=1 Tax=Glossina pallidipes TaxID=7398 RepID=A0A1A9ZJK6_GLOPL
MEVKDELKAERQIIAKNYAHVLQNKFRLSDNGIGSTGKCPKLAERFHTLLSTYAFMYFWGGLRSKSVQPSSNVGQNDVQVTEQNYEYSATPFFGNGEDTILEYHEHSITMHNVDDINKRLYAWA